MFIRHYFFIFALAIITCDALQCLECDDDHDNLPNCTNPRIITNRTCTTCWASARLIDRNPWEMGCSQIKKYEYCREWDSIHYKCYCKEDDCNRKIRKYALRDSYLKLLAGSVLCYECDDNDSNKANCDCPTIMTNPHCKSCYAKQVEGQGTPYEMGCVTRDNKFCTDYPGKEYKCYCQTNGCNTNVEKYFLDNNYKKRLDKTNFGALWIFNNTGNPSLSTIFAFTDDDFNNRAIFHADNNHGPDDVTKKGRNCVHKGVFYKGGDKNTPIKAFITNKNCEIFNNPNNKGSYKPGNYTAVTHDKKIKITYGVREYFTSEVRRKYMRGVLGATFP